MLISWIQNGCWKGAISWIKNDMAKAPAQRRSSSRSSSRRGSTCNGAAAALRTTKADGCNRFKKLLHSIENKSLIGPAVLCLILSAQAAGAAGQHHAQCTNRCETAVLSIDNVITVLLVLQMTATVLMLWALMATAENGITQSQLKPINKGQKPNKKKRHKTKHAASAGANPLRANQKNTATIGPCPPKSSHSCETEPNQAPCYDSQR